MIWYIIYAVLVPVMYIVFKKAYLYDNNLTKEDYLISDRNVIIFLSIFWIIAMWFIATVVAITWNERNKHKQAKW